VKVKLDLSLGSFSFDDDKVNFVKNSKFIFRRKESLRDDRSYIDKYIDSFFKKNILRKDLTIA